MAEWLARNWIGCTVAVALLVFLNFCFQFFFEWYPDWVLFEVGYAVLSLAIPFCIRTLVFAFREFAGPLSGIAGFSKEEAELWTRERLAFLFQGRRPLSIALLMTVAGVSLADIFGLPYGGFLRGLFYLWSCVFFFGYGLIAVLFLGWMVLMSHMSALDVKMSVFSWPRLEIEAVYRSSFRLLALGAALYGIVVVSAWISPGGEEIIRETLLGALWVFPPGAMVAFFFLHFHYRTHLLLKQCRDRGERELRELMSGSFAAWKREPEGGHGESIGRLEGWLDRLRKERLWVIDLKATITTVTTIFLPTIHSLAEYFASFFRG